MKWFAGRVFDDIATRIMLTEGDHVDFEIERAGEVMTVRSEFNIPDTPWYKRRALPQVGLAPAGPAIVGEFIEGNGESPAQRAGLKPGDEVIEVNGQKIYGFAQVTSIIRDSDWAEANFKVKRGDEILDMKIKAVKPIGGGFEKPMMGISWDSEAIRSMEILHPNPYEQVRDSLRTMWMTIKVVSSPKSHVGIDQLSGPVGIARTKFLLLQEPHGWLQVLAFFVLFNVNLAVLNMLPLPVLDGGHIVMAILEAIRGKALPGKFLEVIQTAFALILMGFMLFVTTKDIGDFGGGGSGEKEELVWPEPDQAD